MNQTGSGCRSGVGRIFALCLAILSLTGCKPVTMDRWYRDYFTIVTMPDRMSKAEIERCGFDAYRAGTLFGGWYGAWYPSWQQAQKYHQNAKPWTERVFKRNVMYYDGGEVGSFAVFLGPDGKMVTGGWTLQSWTGTPPLRAYWFGIDSFFKKENPFPLPNYEAFGLKPFTYPDGTPATNVYEVLGRRNVEGELNWNEPFCNEKITDEQAQKSGLAAISEKHFEGEHVDGRNGWTTVRLMTQDYANPQLRDYQAWEMAELTRKVRPDGWHIDNFGDNNLYRPFKTSMGIWSEQTFREFMKRHFPAKKLAEIGITDINTFDIKQYIRERRKLDAQEVYSSYDEPKWKDDLIFKCYLINHVQESVKFHAAKYDAIKRAASEVDGDVLVSGNLIPLFPGFTLLNGKIDVSHFEWNSLRDCQPSRRDMGLPPSARSGYVTRLASAVGRENYSIVSLYVNHELRGPSHENLFLAQAFEALPNRCLIDYGHAYLDQYSAGSSRTAGIYNRFIAQHRCDLSRRDLVGDIGLVYDQWADVASSTACQMDVNDFFNEYAGWCDYLADSHRQWKVLLSTELSHEKIKDMPLIILPSAISLTDANFRCLETYLKKGGHVLATGKTGLRYGPEGYLMKRTVNPLEQYKKYPGFRWVIQQPGASYWQSKEKAAMQQMSSLITYPDLCPVVETDAEIHVGVVLSRSLPGEPNCLSLDLNNNNFDVKSDRFLHTKPFQVTIQMSRDFRPPFQVTVAEPGKERCVMEGKAVVFDSASGRLTLKFPPFECYRFVKIEPQRE